MGKGASGRGNSMCQGWEDRQAWRVGECFGMEGCVLLTGGRWRQELDYMRPGESYRGAQGSAGDFFFFLTRPWALNT